MKPSKGLSTASVVLAFAMAVPALNILTSKAEAGNVAAAANLSATDAMKVTINEVLRLLRDKNMDDKKRVSALEQTVAQRFDYNEISRRVLGAEWNKLDDRQKNEFVDLFQTFLSAVYAGKIKEYAGQDVVYKGERTQDKYAEVQTKVFVKSAEIPMDYRLINKNDEWRVYDVVVDNISLVNNYRGQFRNIISKNGYPELLNQLRKKIDDNQKTSSISPAPANPPALMLAGTGGRCC